MLINILRKLSDVRRLMVSFKLTFISWIGRSHSQMEKVVVSSHPMDRAVGRHTLEVTVLINLHGLYNKMNM